jgi:hypothetical protein
MGEDLQPEHRRPAAVALMGGGNVECGHGGDARGRERR